MGHKRTGQEAQEYKRQIQRVIDANSELIRDKRGSQAS